MDSLTSSDMSERRGTFVGTINYLAPEMIQECTSTCETDLWALGCIIFKMATGKVPFPGTQIHTVFPMIIGRQIDWPENQELDPDMKSLIEELLQIDPSARLGARNANNDMTALKAHPFFEGVKWGIDDMIDSGMKQLLKETESMETKQARVSMIGNQTLPAARYGLTPHGQPILKGQLLKKNKFFMKQERLFELFMNGTIKYFNGAD